MTLQKLDLEILEWESTAISHTDNTYIFNGITFIDGEIMEYQYTKKEDAIYWIKDQPYF